MGAKGHIVAGHIIPGGTVDTRNPLAESRNTQARNPDNLRKSKTSANDLGLMSPAICVD